MSSAWFARLGGAAALGLVVGLLGVLAGFVPWVAKMEDRAGLPWLFSLRGPRPVPAGIVLVSIDEHTGTALGLPAEPADWPRTIFAGLVDVLRANEARLIVFDVFFPDRGAAADDQVLAAAMTRAGNVLVTARLDREMLAGLLRVELELPQADVSAAAAGVAPFPLPVAPVQISQFWTFHAGAGDLPTLPALAAHQAVAGSLPELARRATATCPAVVFSTTVPQAGLAAADVLRTRRAQVFAAPPACRRKLLREATARPGDLAVLANLYAGAPSRYLNYYGAPGSFPALRFQDLLRAPPAVGALHDKLVFVGFTARDPVGQEDSFFTVFSDDAGLNLSGVEIAATATANLLAGDGLRPLPVPAAAALVVAWGVVLGFVCRLLPGATGAAASACGALGWLLAALWCFGSRQLWLPVMVPIFLQVPLAIGGGLLMQFRHARVQRARIAAALGRYVPTQLVDRLAEGGVSATASAAEFYGTCMATDASRYTPLAETLTPEALGLTLNAYFDILFAEVERHGGAVADILGDAMMAIWVSGRPGSGIERRACEAALAILAGLELRQAAGLHAALPTRIGLHAGIVHWGTVGARGRLEIRAVGDIVNTAARIEGLNRYLGTRVLASAAALAGCDGLRERAVGRFLLAGKSQPVAVHELLAPAAAAETDRLACFARALALFQEGSWRVAWPLFQECAEWARPGAVRDPVAAFYAGLCVRFERDGTAGLVAGAVVIDGK